MLGFLLLDIICMYIVFRLFELFPVKAVFDIHSALLFVLICPSLEYVSVFYYETDAVCSAFVQLDLFT